LKGREWGGLWAKVRALNAPVASREARLRSAATDFEENGHPVDPDAESKSIITAVSVCAHLMEAIRVKGGDASEQSPERGTAIALAMKI
jgi:hypothetical protein